jgi:hypothetical protein
VFLAYLAGGVVDFPRAIYLLLYYYICPKELMQVFFGWEIVQVAIFQKNCTGAGMDLLGGGGGGVCTPQ